MTSENIKSGEAQSVCFNQSFDLSRSRIDVYILSGVLFYLATVVFEGPIRYALSYLNAGTLLYVRDLIVSLVVTLTIVALIAKSRNLINPLFVSAYFLLLYFFVGLLTADVPIFSGFFGLKIFAITLFGISLSFYLTSLHVYIYRATLFFLVTTVLGVFLNFIVGKFPWEGQEFETAFGVVTTTREWWTNQGGRRLPGFTRASFDAAMVIGVSFAYVINRFTKIAAAFWGSIFLIAVYLTTSKGMVLAIVLLLLWYVVPFGWGRIVIARLVIVTLLLILIALPLFSCGTSSSFKDFIGFPHILFSFVDRIVNTWPHSCSLLIEPYSWILGAGVGSIGVPLQYNYSARMLSPADNLFVYIFVSGGVVWVIGLILTIYRAMSFSNYAVNQTDDWHIRVHAMLIIFLAYGITSNMHEQPFYSVYAGLLVGIVWRSHRAPS